MTYRSVIIARIVPGSEEKVGEVFGYYDRTTRPQDLGVIARRLLSLDDLYIHVIERNIDPKLSLGKARGLPAFQQIAEAIAPYVTPYPRNWKNPSDSVAHEFYSWTPPGSPEPDPNTPSENLTVIVARIKPGAEPDVARVFGESDAGPLPIELGVTGRWLYSNDDVYLHLLERTDEAFAEAMRESHAKPAFAKIMDDLRPFVTPYNPETWRGPEDAVAKEFYRWRAED
ncbi:TcmI family type II polyketide cyclase [Micromonospora echinofusca]|uniref:TcmI family type II polyketide cyclase n=1 Tax=Micromonospora echinofusca TaxID=47858 RepID=A0ABS3W0S7_MICEH|nr:TcmI family type II polyketide cyclase [Micromonospora echinofusca]MBO4210397.1 TcmI family type II polyketide cyclase [Micromonospora echinofusca]